MDKGEVFILFFFVNDIDVNELIGDGLILWRDICFWLIWLFISGEEIISCIEMKEIFLFDENKESDEKN